MSVDLVLNLMGVEHRIGPFLYPPLKKVRRKRLILFSIRTSWDCSGSIADKAGLCVDDEVISMNDENIENMTFDQVRKILKERNLRGNIKMLIRTYEGKIDLSDLTNIISLLIIDAQIYLMIILKLLSLHRRLIIVEHHHHINQHTLLLCHRCLHQHRLNHRQNLLLFHRDLPRR